MESKYIELYKRQNKQLINIQKTNYEIKVNVTQPIFDPQLKQEFNIVEGKNCFRIRWREDNCRKEKKISFAKTCTKEEAYIKIQHEKKKLDEKYISFEDICSFDDNF